MAGADVLVVSLGTTAGLRHADAELVASLRRAGTEVVMARAAPVPRVRTMALTDLLQARAARRAAAEAIAAQRPRAIVYSTTTAALLAPVPGAVRFDALAAANRPGRHGLGQRPLARRRLGRAPLLLPWSEAAMAGLDAGPASRAVIVPVPVTSARPRAANRDIAALTYAADPVKKGLDRVLGVWAQARRPGEGLVVVGAPRASVPVGTEGVEWVGVLEHDAYRALLRRARVFVTAPAREDHGLAQLEALADGCQLVSTAAPGPYAALPIARALDPRLIGEDLAAALRAALDDPVPDYAGRAAAALAPWRPEAIDRIVAERVLPRLLGEQTDRRPT